MILPLYAALLALLFIYLSSRVIGVRRGVGVAVGDGGSPELLRTMRVHANWAEYVPISLMLIGLVEVQGAPTALVHALGLALLLARLSHAFGVSQMVENFRFRVGGMVGTLSVIGVSSLWLLGTAAYKGLIQ